MNYHFSRLIYYDYDKVFIWLDGKEMELWPTKRGSFLVCIPIQEKYICNLRKLME